MKAALYGSFLPVPLNKLFYPSPAEEIKQKQSTSVPGYIFTPKDDRITLNKGKDIIVLTVTNTGDRPIQVSII
jgi:hypothetical protein